MRILVLLEHKHPHVLILGDFSTVLCWTTTKSILMNPYKRKMRMACVIGSFICNLSGMRKRDLLSLMAHFFPITSLRTV